jgi:hypothetical protein
MKKLNQQEKQIWLMDIGLSMMLLMTSIIVCLKDRQVSLCFLVTFNVVAERKKKI